MKFKKEGSTSILTSITKTEIEFFTVCTRGSGFNPQWKYKAFITDGRNFEEFKKPFVESIVYRNDQPLKGEVKNKKEFIDLIYKNINNGNT